MKYSLNNGESPNQPLSELKPGHIGILTAVAKNSKMGVGELVVGGVGEILFPCCELVHYGDRAALSASYKFRSLRPDEQLTFTME